MRLNDTAITVERDLARCLQRVEGLGAEVAAAHLQAALEAFRREVGRRRCSSEAD